MSTPEERPTPTPAPVPAAPPPVSEAYPVYGDVGADVSAPTPAAAEQATAPDVAGGTSSRRFATYNAATTRSSGGLAAFVVIGLVMLVIFGFVAQLIFQSFTDSVDEGVPSDFPTEIMDDAGLPEDFANSVE